MNSQLRSSRNWPYIAGYLLVWAGLFAVLIRSNRFAPEEAVAGFLILGLAFPGLALILTRRAAPIDHHIRNAERECILLFGYLFFIAFVLVNGFGPASRIATEPQHTLAIFATKLLVFVFLPAVLLTLLQRYSWNELFTFSFRWRAMVPAIWMSLAGLAMQSFLGRGLRDIQGSGLPARALLLATPLSLLFLLFEVGLVEEFFFRTLLQERLAALLRSPWGGLICAALLFGLVHAPGFYLRPAATQEALGPHPSLFFAISYSVVITSLSGLFLGILWMRTKNLAVVAIVHAASDFLPNLVPFCKSFHLH
jgi:membrane protease YdiL (CAAX protease family)